MLGNGAWKQAIIWFIVYLYQKIRDVLQSGMNTFLKLIYIPVMPNSFCHQSKSKSVVKGWIVSRRIKLLETVFQCRYAPRISGRQKFPY